MVDVIYITSTKKQIDGRRLARHGARRRVDRSVARMSSPARRTSYDIVTVVETAAGA